MHSRILLLSFGLHGALIVGVASFWGLGPQLQRPDLRLAVAPPAPDLAWPPDDPRPEPPRSDPESDELELIEAELPVPGDLPDPDLREDDLGPWPAPRMLQWTPAALVDLARRAESPPPPEVEIQPPAPLVRARLCAGTNTAPSYPRSARRRGLEGTVVLRLHVDADGAVRQVELAAPCRHEVLNDAAVEAARAWRFEPATQGGAAVADVVEQTVRFELRGG